MAKKKPQALIQTTVPPPVRRKLDILVKAAGRKRADYLRRLVTSHVNAVSPVAIKGMERAWRGVKETT